MNKFITFMLCLFMTISLLACGQKTTPPAETKTNPESQAKKDTTGAAVTYKDGTYEGIGDKWKYGQESSVVIIEGGKIKSIVLKRLDTNGKEVNYDEWTGAKDASGNTRPNLKQFRGDMANKMLAKQSTDVDTIATATVSTANWKVATQRALDSAKTK